MKDALKGIRVLDMSRVLAGPWATQMLGDLGADIVKVERPGEGDDTRGWGPPWHGEGESRQSAYFLSANRNKRSVTIDIAQAEGQDLVRRLAADSDIVVENFKLGGLAKYGLDHAALSAVNPRLIYCSITGFGQSGPEAHRAGYDFMLQGMSGLMSVTGEPGGAPQKVGVALVDVMTGLHAAIAVLAALHERARSGRGQHIDLALFDVGVSTLANQALNALVSGEAPRRLGNAHPNIVPYQAFETEDGWIILAIGNDRQFRAFAALAEIPALAEARFATNAGRVEHREALIPEISVLMRQRSTAEWMRTFEAEHIPAGRINDIPQALAEPQAAHRGLSMSLSGNGNPVPSVANPLLAAEPPGAPLPPPPLGFDTRIVLADRLGLSDAELDALAAKRVI